MNRDEVASAVAKRLGLNISPSESWAHSASIAEIWDALIDSEMRIQELSEALRQGILAMTGRARNVWADKARALLSEEKPR